MDENVLFEVWVKDWLDYERNFLKESSYGSYSTAVYNHLIPHIGNLRLSEINHSAIQELIIELSKNGRKDGKGGLAPKTIKDIITILECSLKKAENDNLIQLKRRRLEFPKSGKKQLTLMEEPDQMKLKKIVFENPTPKNIGIFFALQTGIRIGELCALRHSDIDLRQKTVTINNTLQRVFTKYAAENLSKIIIGTPKSLSSVRVIPLTNMMLSLLQNLEFYSADNFFLTNSEKYIEPRAYAQYYKHFLKKADIKYVNFHCLRHTFATRCIEAGGDYKIVSEVLGHSSIKITMDLYVHPQMELKRKCMELVDFQHDL